MCAVFCGESAPLEQYYCNYTFPVLSFLPPAHVHTMILQNVCFFCEESALLEQYNYSYTFPVLPFLLLAPVQLQITLSGLAFPSASTHAKPSRNGALDMNAN